MKYVLLMTLSVMTALAQLPGPIIRTPPFPAALQRYLELSTDQANAILRLNANSVQFQVEKLRRASQVQIELAQETAKTTLDPMALGVRYVELEAIRRETRAEQERAYAEIQKVLTAAQKTKVQALVDAMRLQSLVCDAQALNILPGSLFLPGPGITFPGLLDPSQGLVSSLPGIPGAFGLGCASAFRTGDFTITPSPIP